MTPFKTILIHQGLLIWSWNKNWLLSRPLHWLHLLIWSWKKINSFQDHYIHHGLLIWSWKKIDSFQDNYITKYDHCNLWVVVGVRVQPDQGGSRRIRADQRRSLWWVGVWVGFQPDQGGSRQIKEDQGGSRQMKVDQRRSLWFVGVGDQRGSCKLVKYKILNKYKFLSN